MLSLNTKLIDVLGDDKSKPRAKRGGLVVKHLKTLGLKTVQDLLFYFPFRYEDFRLVVPINKIQPDVPVTVKGVVQLIGNKRSFYQKSNITEIIISDGTGQLKIVWFRQPYLSKTLKVGDKIAVAGKVEFGRYGVQMTNPVYEKEKENEGFVHTGRLVPIYPSTKGLTQKQLRFLISQCLPSAGLIKDWLPEEIIKKNNFLSLGQSIKEIHFPVNDKNFKLAQTRFQFEQVFLMQLQNELSRQEIKQLRAPNLFFRREEIKEFVNALPYSLTTDQRKAAWEILQDLEKTHPMNRLLNGDVGSGKTVVAAIAIQNTVLNGYQAILMVPTEILAEQHFQTFSKLLPDKRIGLLTSKMLKINNNEIKPSKKEFLEMLKKGEVDICIGTHSLISDSVKFKKIGLAVVDEQHRFGVKQRHAMIVPNKKQKTAPHFLSMTATPIPRSYALAMYGDLDLSLIKQMPKGRQVIITRVVDETNRHKAYEFIRREVKKGRQAFVVCPLIEEKEESESKDFGFKMEQKTVMAEYKKLSEQVFSDLNITYLHGKIKAVDKEQIMKDFGDKKLDVLISTSVVEVGVDFPNATIMMIEGAERFGVAQLHQFRGRVGRGIHQSYCLLFTNSTTEKVKERLSFFAKTSDGFTLAEKDLETRGPGAIFGMEQHGFSVLKTGELGNMEMIKKSREAAAEIVANDPKLAIYPLLKEKILQLEKTVHLE